MDARVDYMGYRVTEGRTSWVYPNARSWKKECLRRIGVATDFFGRHPEVRGSIMELPWEVKL